MPVSAEAARHPFCSYTKSLHYFSENTCRECPIGCADCINEKKCSSCSDGYYLDETCKKCYSNCLSCDNGSECKTCVDNYYLNNSICLQCSPGCKTCTTKGDEKNQNCTSCLDNLYLVNGGEFESNCVENCPENTFLNVTQKICNYVKPNTIVNLHLY